MGFKEEADFARLVSMGAVGSAAVASHLRSGFGHRPIELERYAMANKVWKTKVKRLRLPDLVCMRCGLRIESRAKSKLAIILSHSDTEGREWDAGGMRNQDLFAFLRVDISDGSNHTSDPFYFSTAALRAAIGQSKRSKPKASSEGSEVTLTWPSWIPAKSGTLVKVDDEDRIVCKWSDGSTYRYWQWRRWEEPRFAYLDSGAAIEREETIVAGVVKPSPPSQCPGEIWDLAEALSVDDEVDRYAAAKAASWGNQIDLKPVLRQIANSRVEDWRLRLEALAALSRFEPSRWTPHIKDLIRSGMPEQKMEAVLVLAERQSQEAGDALAQIASNSSLPTELRAAAAWGLGQGKAPRPRLLLPITLAEDDLVALHAITALENLPDELLPTLAGWLSEANNRRAATAAQLLQRHQRVDALLDACERNQSARLWALRALGDLSPQLVRNLGGDKLTPEVVKSLEPMWRGQDDWLRTTGKDGLEALDVQKIRYDPANPTL